MTTWTYTINIDGKHVPREFNSSRYHSVNYDNPHGKQLTCDQATHMILCEIASHENVHRHKINDVRIKS